MAASKYTVDKKWKGYIEHLLGELVGQVEHLVETINQIRDKLETADESSRRSGSKLMTQTKTV